MDDLVTRDTDIDSVMDKGTKLKLNALRPKTVNQLARQAQQGHTRITKALRKTLEDARDVGCALLVMKEKSAHGDYLSEDKKTVAGTDISRTRSHVYTKIAEHWHLLPPMEDDEVLSITAAERLIKAELNGKTDQIEDAHGTDQIEDAQVISEQPAPKRTPTTIEGEAQLQDEMPPTPAAPQNGRAGQQLSEAIDSYIKVIAVDMRDNILADADGTVAALGRAVLELTALRDEVEELTDAIH